MSDVCQCSLQLGFHPFPKNVNQNEDLLGKRFQCERFSFYNAAEKKQEKLPLFETLHMKTEETYFLESSSRFKLFPPAIIPENDILPGFPKNFVKMEEFSAKSIDEKHKWFSSFSEKYAEQMLGQGFISHFTKNQEMDGFLFHPYCSETFLEPIKKKASIQRKNEANYKKCRISILPLSETELNICDSLGVEIRNLVQETKSEMDNEELKLFAEKLSHRATRDKKEILKSLAWGKSNLNTSEEVKNHIVYNFYLSEIQARNFETDMLLVLKDYQAIVDIEIKSTPDNQNKSIKSVLEKASRQLKKANKTLSGCHKDILNETWNFVKVIAIPNIDKTVIDGSVCCHYCSQFLIDTTAVEDISNWITNLMKNMKTSKQSIGSYRTLFTRVVGFASISNSLQKSVSLTLADLRAKYEKAIIGEERGISSEQILTGESLPYDIDECTLDKLKKKKGMKHLSSLSVLFYWNPSQLSVLLNRREKNKRVLLDSDFGCGKTLLMKHFASILAEELVNVQEEKIQEACYKPVVFFISLSAAKEQNIYHFSNNEKTIYTSYRRPAIIDVSNQMEFEGKNVQVVDVKDLIAYSYGDQTTTINDLLVRFMKDHPEDHFFIDELPVKSGVDTIGPLFQGPDLVHLTGVKSKNCTVWITLRPSEIGEERYEEYIKDADEYKKNLRKEGFYTPSLTHNMRNASSVIEGLNCFYSQRENLNYHGGLKPVEWTPKLTIPKAPLPPNTVSGSIPVFIPITLEMQGSISKVIVPVIEKYFADPKEPIVVLVKDKRRVDQVLEGCRILNEQRKITSYRTRTESFNDEDIEKLKQFLSKPDGVLVTDADAFGGMQARNVIVVGESTRKVRNYVMRAISQVIFIQNFFKLDKTIDMNPQIIVDKTLTENFQQTKRTLRRKTALIWLWHLPSGTYEGDIKEHVDNKSNGCHLLEITKLEHENRFIGYKLKIDMRFDDSFMDQSFWPAGWIARRYNANIHGIEQSQMAPTDIKLYWAKNEEEIRNYAGERGVTVIEVTELQHKDYQVYRWKVRVHEDDYKKIIDPQFWKLNAWSVRAMP